MPKRIQRKRSAGWRMPPNSISVTRPGKYGNPYRIGYNHGGVLISTVEACLELYRYWVQGQLLRDPTWLDELRGKDLACFCKEGDPCHADVLLELSNK